MPANPQSLIAKINALPADRIGEVENFVDFISAKSRRKAALERLLAIAPAIQAAGLPPISEEEILAEVQAVRSERRRRGLSADRP